MIFSIGWIFLLVWNMYVGKMLNPTIIPQSNHHYKSTMYIYTPFSYDCAMCISLCSMQMCSILCIQWRIHMHTQKNRCRHLALIYRFWFFYTLNNTHVTLHVINILDIACILGNRDTIPNGILFRGREGLFFLFIDSSFWLLIRLLE